MSNRETIRMSAAQKLHKLLEKNEILVMPACFDALSARLIQAAGFPATFMSGFGVAATRLGMPDTGLISYGEMLDQGRTSAARFPYPCWATGTPDSGTR